MHTILVRLKSLQLMWENGILLHWADKYLKGLPKPDRCEYDKIKPTGQAKILTLKDLSSAFILLGIGFSLALLVFCVEIVVFKLGHKK